MLKVCTVLRLGWINRSSITLSDGHLHSLRLMHSPPSGQNNSGLVAAAFAHLNTPESGNLDKQDAKVPSPKSSKINKVQITDQQIANASDINSLLTIAEAALVSRKHALKIVSKLSDWSTSNKVKLSDFETDVRFLKLCRILGRNRQGNVITNMTRSDDLSTVLSITGEDEAARLITDLTMPQMVKVMSALAKKGSRSTPILQAVAYNISRQGETLNMKQSADLLFSMASLNFPDPVLIDRICCDIQTSLPNNTDRHAVVTSILRSLSSLKYKDVDILRSLTDWIVTHHDLFSPEDVATALVTAGTLGWVPENEEFLKLALQISEGELSKPSTWLNLVYSLAVINKTTVEHLKSTFSKDFLDKLSAFYKFELPIPVRRKLINLEAYTSTNYLNYDGQKLPVDIYKDLPLVYTKEKQMYVQSIHDAFNNIVSSENFLKRNCDSGMGFMYDGEFVVDEKCNPVPLEKMSKGHHRIALLALDYHDFCRHTVEPLGFNLLYIHLLEKKNCKVLPIPYTEYNPREKLLTRVQYIQKKLKEIVTNH